MYIPHRHTGRPAPFTRTRKHTEDQSKDHPLVKVLPSRSNKKKGEGERERERKRESTLLSRVSAAVTLTSSSSPPSPPTTASSAASNMDLDDFRLYHSQPPLSRSPPSPPSPSAPRISSPSPSPRLRLKRAWFPCEPQVLPLRPHAEPTGSTTSLSTIAGSTMPQTPGGWLKNSAYTSLVERD